MRHRRWRNSVVATLAVLLVVADLVVAADPVVGAVTADDLGVSPHANLRDHQAIVVSGIQYVPGSPIRVEQCAPTRGRCRLDPTDATVDEQGHYVVRGFEVRRLVTRPDGAPIDCATVQCRIVVSTPDRSERSVSRILTFDPAAPFDAPPTLTAAPNTGLAAAEVVGGTYRGFAPNERITIRVCRVGGPGDVCDVGVDNFASETGTERFAYQVHRRITDTAGHEHDCADPVGTCVLEVVGTESGDVAAAALGFDATDPLPLVSVDDGTDLPYRGAVTARGRGLPPGTVFTAAMCATDGVRPTACAESVTGTSDATGRLDLGVPFRRRVDTYTLDLEGLHQFRFDCTETRVTCAVRFSGGGTSAGDRVTFDRGAPIPAAPTIEVTPSRDLPTRTVVGVTGSGFLPNRVVTLGQCDTTPSQFGQEVCPGASTTIADPAGRIATIAVVRRRLPLALGTRDCAAAVGTCAFRATTDPGVLGESPEDTEVVRVPLGFDPTAPPVSPPVTVTPSTGLRDVQSVTVAGSGFPSRARIRIVSCRATLAPSAGDCEESTAIEFDADPQGSFRHDYTVHQVLAMFDNGTVDCNRAPNRCVLAVGVKGDPSIATLVPLSFSASGPTPVVTARSRAITEPSGASHSTKIDLVLSEPTDHVVRVRWQTAVDGTATGTLDYRTMNGELAEFAPGQTVVTVRVDVVGDRTDEPDEWFPLKVYYPVGATTGPDARITIRDDDPPTRVQVGNVTVRETDGIRYAKVPLRLGRPSGLPVSVRFRTFPFTATSGRDYVDTSGTVVIPPYRTRGVVAVVILGDSVPEGPEGVLVAIDAPTNATVAREVAVLTITDDD